MEPTVAGYATPTYVPAGDQLFECGVCGAAVTDRARHDAWHLHHLMGMA